MIRDKSRLTNYLDKHYYVNHFIFTNKHRHVVIKKDNGIVLGLSQFVDDIRFNLGYKLEDVGTTCREWYNDKKNGDCRKTFIKGDHLYGIQNFPFEM